jgi:16S rRNA (guanine966-N2)-methyltransferase
VATRKQPQRAGATKARSKSAPAATGRLRIIAGEWRSRQLPVLDLPGLRPTTDRVRETLFNWLQNDIAGARCLDLFAGSGALGFEAASRGAASVTLLELQAAAADQLAANMQLLQANNMQLVRANALDWLAQYQGEPFDLVFLDPPFASDLLEPAMRCLHQQHLLSSETCVYIECDAAQPLPTLPPGWQLAKQKKAGQVSYYLIRLSAFLNNPERS